MEEGLGLPLKEEERVMEDVSSPSLEDGDIIKKCHDKDQHIESSHEEAIVEESVFEDLVKRSQGKRHLEPYA